MKRNRVLLIHGIDDTVVVFDTMSAYLKQRGWDVYSLDLIPCNGDCGLDLLARQVADYVTKTFRPSELFDLVGFSMGGIISRYYVQRLGGISRVERFITISSPHHGSWLGYARQNPGCRQQRPESDFLQDLNRDAAMLARLNFTSIWTPFDLMILPANSSSMPVGKEITVPILVHSWMVRDSQSLRLVAQELMEPLRNKYEA
ncbi:MAG: alpha/beta fold hydrolase [Hormoscilla sp. GM102CHS1]|nr:alpha/beta fold hydrolase [Hormoscilla sp. GM102CHS1]